MAEQPGSSSSQKPAAPKAALRPEDVAVVQGFMTGAQVLIVDLSSSSRPVLRRLMGEMGAKTPCVSVAENFEEAVRLVEEKKPQVVFAEFQIGSRTALDLFREYSRVVPSRLQSVFSVISGDNSPATTTALAEADVDLVFVRPLNFQVLCDKFVECLLTKAKPTPYLKFLEAGRRFLEMGKFDAALRAIQQAREADPKSARAYAMEGALKRKQGDLGAALYAFEAGLQFQPDNYRCLLGAFEILTEQKKAPEAYAAGMKLLDHYPLNPKRIPDMIRLCIVTANFAEIMRFVGTALELNLSKSENEMLSKYVTAGMFICGKHLLKLGKKEEGLKVLKRTEALSRGKPRIQSEIIAALYTAGLVSDAEEMLRRAPPEVSNSSEVRLAILDQLHFKGVDVKALHLSLELIHDGVATPQLFEIALIQAKGMARPESVIQDLCLRAIQAFPDKREFYEGLCDDPARRAAG